MNGGSLPSGGVLLGRVCAYSLCSRLVLSLLCSFPDNSEWSICKYYYELVKYIKLFSALATQLSSYYSHHVIKKVKKKIALNMIVESLTAYKFPPIKLSTNYSTTISLPHWQVFYKILMEPNFFHSKVTTVHMPK